VKIRLDSAPSLEGAWAPAAPETLLERRYANGRLMLAVEHDPALGYRVWAPGYGRHLVSPDGRLVTSALPRISEWRWQRLLFAQVLPLAATLRGLELLHGSAVDLDGRTVVFVAASGTGKTSLAAHLVAGGGSLLTDDVLALECRDGELLGHPGAPLSSLDPEQLRAIPAPRRDRLGRRVGRSYDVMLAPKLLERARPLHALFVLQRSERRRGPLRIERLVRDPLRVLAHSFNTYVRSKERVVNQLAISARLLERVEICELTIPAGCTAADTASAVRSFVRGLG
jgi:hypothetical protein